MSVREDFEREWAVAGMPKDKQRLVRAAFEACAAQYEAEQAKLKAENRELILDGIDHMRHGIALIGKHHQADEMAELKAYLESTCTRIDAELSKLKAERNSLLAVIEKQREALQCVDLGILSEGMAIKVEEALAITSDSVRLVEVGVINGCDKAPELSNGTATIFFGEYLPGTKLYTIVEGKAE